MRYFKIEGIIETNMGGVNSEDDLDRLSVELLKTLESMNCTFGGGIAEVDSEGNYLKHI